MALFFDPFSMMFGDRGGRGGFGGGGGGFGGLGSQFGQGVGAPGFGGAPLLGSGCDVCGTGFDLTDLLTGAGGFDLLPWEGAGGRGGERSADITRPRDVSNWGTRRNPNTVWCDVFDTPDGYMIVADIPGVRKEDVQLNLDGRRLIIKFNRKPPQEGQWRRHERDYGTFRRTLRLPENVDTDKMTAKVENGQLIIYIPKKEAGQQQHKRISVEEARPAQGTQQQGSLEGGKQQQQQQQAQAQPQAQQQPEAQPQSQFGQQPSKAGMQPGVEGGKQEEKAQSQQEAGRSVPVQ